MTRAATWLIPAALAILWSCGAPEPAPPPSTPAPPPAPEHLPLPFTADQICAEWVEGFSLVMRSRTPEGESRSRWTVVAADGESVEIEFAALDAEGVAVGEPARQPSTCAELRDHALFPAATASRLETSRDTPLGRLDGWLYLVRQEDGEVNELFFAKDLPGAPVESRTLAGDEVLEELVQVERHLGRP